VSFRLRLALFFTLLVAVTLALVGTATYKLMRRGLLTEIERDVSRRAQAYAASHATPYYLDVFAAPDVFLQVVDDEGRPAASSGNLGDRVLPLTAPMRDGQVVEARVAGRPLYLTAAPLGDGRSIIVARSPITIYGALRRLRGLLYLVIGAAIIVTGSLGWLFARAAVRPIERVVAAAGAVKDSRDLSKRVEHAGPRDEIGRLTATFNGMLAELEVAYRNLDHSHRRMREFLAESAHELRAPLTLILSNLDLLSRSGAVDPAFQAQALADIRGEANRMARMITQLLILGRADAGIQMPAEPVALADAIADACRQGQGMADGVRFIPVIDDRIREVRVKGNADYLTQLVLILLDNAFKFTPAGGEVRLETTVESGRVRLTVSDTGSGIHETDLPRIFDRFYRGANAQGVTGTGLGLTIARWVAEQHDGVLEVDSVPGHGSRFSVVLPVLSSIPKS
jgi:two-component system OmpR family sensor kinase